MSKEDERTEAVTALTVEMFAVATGAPVAFAVEYTRSALSSLGDEATRISEGQLAVISLRAAWPSQDLPQPRTRQNQ